MDDLKRILEVFESRGHDVELVSVSSTAMGGELLRHLSNKKVSEYRVVRRGNLPRTGRLAPDALYVFPSLSDEQRKRAATLEINYVVPSTGELVLKAQDQDVASGNERKTQKRRTRGGVLPGILRAVVREREWLSQKELFTELGVSQQAVSRALKRLEIEYGVNRDTYDPGMIMTAYQALDDLDVAVTWGLAALDGPLSLRPALTEYLNSLDVNWAFTGILAADHYAPWVVPTTLSIMCEEDINLEDVGLFRSEDGVAGAFMIATPSLILKQVVVDETGARFTDPLATWSYLINSDQLDSDQAARALRTWMMNG